ncbi:hypothetical protein [Pseudomonas syringae]|uniref:hypothetical protein n=1 Tax=Pseudomonas syringae TaxID=317 RepID=UPI000A228C6E|nr:hypothetical protein [Pseudomonas syringae]MBL3606639.1 hypothetical protein [Pseudomonas syringae pv. actinidiae]OSR78035.1 hypothetical protein BV327_01164 [Pseudomonas syringae pv. actinidiae]OSS32661.1 hypothetical protein BV337_00496 [Pseudomonas syringae pv. actinidiae]
MAFPLKMIMANHARTPQLTKEFLDSYSAGLSKSVPLYVLKSFISSPRLFDIFLRKFDSDQAIVVGDTFLEKHTMLGDNNQKTYAVSINKWKTLKYQYQEVSDFEAKDEEISKIQVWSFDPLDLVFEQMVLAIAVAYNELELLEEPRLCGALNDLLSLYNIECYWEERSYG